MLSEAKHLARDRTRDSSLRLRPEWTLRERRAQHDKTAAFTRTWYYQVKIVFRSEINR
jgi:hypothetical protein